MRNFLEKATISAAFCLCLMAGRIAAQSMDYGMVAATVQSPAETSLIGGGFQLMGVKPSSGFNPVGASLSDLLNTANMLVVSNSFTTIDLANPGQFYAAGLLAFWSDGSSIASNTQLYLLASTSATFSLTAPWALVTGTDVGWFSPVTSDPTAMSIIEMSLGGNSIVAAGSGGPGVGAYFGSTPGTTNSAGDVSLTLVPEPSPAPAITSPAWPVAVVGQTFSYQITASGDPTVYGASNLPGGLTIDTTNGLITGTPTEPGEFDVTISATNAGGTGNATLTLTISPAPVVAPVISDNTASGTVGTAFTYQISASNSPTSFGAIGLPAGLILDPATGFITGTPTTATTSSVTISATNAGGTGNATLTLTIGAAPPPPFLAPGTYNLPAGAKVKLGVTPPQGSAKYQWLKSGAPVKRATGPELDLTPGTTTFGPAQTGVYQLQQQQGTTVTTLGPWVLTHDDPTILVYNLTLNGTQSTSPDDSRTKGASESAVTMGGFLLVDRTPYDGDPPTADVKATLILTRIDRVGKKVVGSFYWVEPRPDASVHSNGPVPGTKSFPPSRTLVAGLLGTEQREDDPESPLWLAGDRDVLWLSGSDSLVALNKSRPPSLIVAPAVMNGVLGTAKTTESIEIDNFTVTARVNAADTLRARNEGLDMEGVTQFIVDRLKMQKPPFTEIPPGQ